MSKDTPQKASQITLQEVSTLRYKRFVLLSRGVFGGHAAIDVVFAAARGLAAVPRVSR